MDQLIPLLNPKRPPRSAEPGDREGEPESTRPGGRPMESENEAGGTQAPAEAVGSYVVGPGGQRIPMDVAYPLGGPVEARKPPEPTPAVPSPPEPPRRPPTPEERAVEEFRKYGPELLPGAAERLGK